MTCERRAVPLENPALTVASVLSPSALRHSEPGPQSQSPQRAELPQRQVGRSRLGDEWVDVVMVRKA